jgi:hypothetical protein
MSFLDSLFGGEKRELEQVRLPELESWLAKRIEEESAGVVADAKETITSIEDIVSKIRQDIKVLQAAGANEVHPRYDKIVKTARPAYVKSMLLTLEGLDFKGGNLEDIRAYDNRLASALDAIGKAGFGDGKFLMFTFQDEMKRVQGGCKRLLDKKEELDKILSSNDELKVLDDARKNYSLYREKIRRKDAAQTDILRLGRSIADGQEELKRLDSELESMRRSPQHTRAEELKKELIEAEDKVRLTETAVHNTLGPLKSALRKYGKTAFEADKGKLAIMLEEDTVDTFFKSSPDAVHALLDGLEESIKKGSISIKDADKTLKRISAARGQLTKDTQSRRNELAQDVNRIKQGLSSLSSSMEDKAQNDAHSLMLTVEKAKTDLAEAEERLSMIKKESGEAYESLKASMLALGVELAAPKSS